MGMYELTCATRATCDHGSHIVEVGISGPDETQQVSMTVARLMLSSGDALYAVDNEDGVQVGARKGRCGCGTKTIRPETDDTDVLERLGPCP